MITSNEISNQTEGLYESTGILQYSIGTYHKLILLIDPQIAKYYRKLIPVWKRPNGTRYAPHISVIRYEKIPLEGLDKYWGKYENEEVGFAYSNEVQTDGLYFWLNCYSARLEEIRIELGLNPHRSGFSRFHLTIGNYKYS